MFRSLSTSLHENALAASQRILQGDPDLLAQTVADVLVGGIDQLLAHDNLEDVAPAILAQRLSFLEHGLG